MKSGRRPWVRTIDGVVYSRKCYATWRNLFYRCHSPSSQLYKHYGALGIRVCARWHESFANFAHDMGEPPTATHSIQRKNGLGNYCPENCCWATKKEQGANHVRAVERRRITWGLVAKKAGIVDGYVSALLNKAVGAHNSRRTFDRVLREIDKLLKAGWSLSELKQQQLAGARRREALFGVSLRKAA